MTRKKGLHSNPSVAAQMEEVVATGVAEYMHEFTRGIFNDYRSPESLDIIAAGFVRALRMYEAEAKVPLIKTVLYNLLDLKETAQ
jgi:hypothetical protein